MKTDNILYNIVSNAVRASVIYTLLKYIPATQFGQKDVVMITVIILLSVILLENVASICTGVLTTTDSKCNVTCKAPTSLENFADSVQKTIKASEELVKENVAKETIKETVKETVKEEVKETVKEEVKNDSAEPRFGKFTKTEDGYTGFRGIYDGRFESSDNKSEPGDVRNTKHRVGSRAKDDVIADELPYTDYNHLPMAEGHASDAYEYGFSFLPPAQWYPQPPFPPVCVSEKKTPVFPMFTNGTNADLKEFNVSRRIMGPDNINTQYIEEKLNSGR